MRRESALCKKVSMDGLQARICKLFEEGSIAHPNSVFFFLFLLSIRLATLTIGRH